MTPSAADAKLAVRTDPEPEAPGGGGGETDALGSPPEHPSAENTATASATGPIRTTELAKDGIVEAVLGPSNVASELLWRKTRATAPERGY